jgi:hypothetical protein
MHVMLMSVCVFREYRRRESRNYLCRYVNLHLRVYRENVRNFERKERYAKYVCYVTEDIIYNLVIYL